MVKITPKHSFAIRWFHWVNFPMIFMMIWSGILIYWANDEYKITWNGKTIIPIFPQGFYDFFGIPFGLAKGMSFHFTFMWFFALNGLAYFAYLIFSKEYKDLFPNKHSIQDAIGVVLHDFKLSKKPLPPQGKFNGAQRIIYTVIVFLGGLEILTGLAIYKPAQLYWLTALFGGYHTARLIHFIVMFTFVLFFCVHIAMVIMAGWNNFASMVRGFEIEEDAPPKISPQPKSQPEPQIQPNHE